MRHFLYTFTVSYFRSVGTWYAEDDYRHEGYSKDRESAMVRVVAPDKELAVAYVEHTVKYGWSEDAAFRIDDIKEERINKVILAW